MSSELVNLAIAALEKDRQLFVERTELHRKQGLSGQKKIEFYQAHVDRVDRVLGQLRTANPGYLELPSTGWIPSTEKGQQPDIFERVLVMTRDEDDDRYQETAHYNGMRNGSPLYLGEGGKRIKVSHWQRLPAIPITH